MTTDDDLTAADIKRWYQKNGMPYQEEDWGPQAETGESSGQQRAEAERQGDGGRVWMHDSSPGMMWWWEKRHFPWSPRTGSDQEWVSLLDDFFAPYLAMLPRPKGNLLRQVYGDLSTYQEVADDEGLSSKGSAHEAVTRAVRDITRLIANDDTGGFHPPADGRRRDFEDEARAARRVFFRYVTLRRQNG